MFGFLKRMSCFGGAPAPVHVPVPGPRKEVMDKQVEELLRFTILEVLLEKREEQIKGLVEIMALPSPPRTIVTPRTR